MESTGNVHGAQEILKLAFDRFGERIALACSFGKDSVTVLHLARQLCSQVPVIYVDTGLDFPETVAFKDNLVKEWNLNLKRFRPTRESVEHRNALDPDLNLSNPDLCCDLLKVEPTERSLRGLDAWIVGLRRDETEFRRNLQPFEEQEKFNGGTLVRVAPIYDWSEDDVWNYIRKNSVPYHPLYDKGYRSMGCMPCSQAGRWGRYERAGRWVGHDKQKCGIHTFLNKKSNFVEVSKVNTNASPPDGGDNR